MIDIMHSLEKPMNQLENNLDPQLWHACAGGMAQIPPLNSNVYYFPQGHVEHAAKNVDFRSFPRISSLVPCRVASIRYLADAGTDEVYAKIGLVPLREGECEVDDGVGLLGFDRNGEDKEKPNSFAKTLTQSDANNGGGFSVPRYCAETIFPRLDYTAEPPVQTILAKDVHGAVWKFRHIYRGTPRRHLLTTGWSNFVNQKKLLAGDSIVFLRSENGELCVGIRRAKLGIGGRPEVSSGWNVGAASGGSSLGRSGLYGFSSEVKEKCNVKAESVIEAVSLAASGQPFEVVYYPRASTPEFVVKASAVRAAMRVQWCPGIRFKMAFETEDSSRISWFMGTISSVQVDDPIHWPNSPWRILQVAWDEPDLLQNVKRVNPWLVELVSSIPSIHLSPFSFSPTNKRPRQYSEYLSMLLNNPLSPSSPLCCLPDNISTGIQGARHAQFVLSSSDLHLNKLQLGLRPFDFKPLDYGSELPKFVTGHPPENPNSNASPHYPKTESSVQHVKKPNEGKNGANAPIFVLFGQPILTEQQISQSCSVDAMPEGTASPVESDCATKARRLTILTDVGNDNDGNE
ncbi:auxin response factor 18-like [Salvia splendens]|uniref:auxin response factor 18-like n=1 Tax=Salvia splendens TaxID=180675 RepID=UPI001C25FE94|nr:auxin response factor 18-like [Salvia splendens]XP_042015712.1 auxin response factor 18-like [Salvia splendens]